MVVSVVLALVLGGLLALPLGRQRQVSVEVWLVITALWLALSTTLNLLDQTPTVPTRLRALWRRDGTGAEPADRLPRGLMALEGTLISARDNDRAYALRLRPRLKRVTDHHLRSHLGIDGDREPDRAAAALGQSAWLVDLDGVGRTPTLPEIEQLLTLVLEPQPTPDSDGPPPGAGVLGAAKEQTR